MCLPISVFGAIVLVLVWLITLLPLRYWANVGLVQLMRRAVGELVAVAAADVLFRATNFPLWLGVSREACDYGSDADALRTWIAFVVVAALIDGCGVLCWCFYKRSDTWAPGIAWGVHWVGAIVFVCSTPLWA